MARQAFSRDANVEFCRVPIHDISQEKWLPATYVGPHGAARGRHLVREPGGNIVSVPRRRLRHKTAARPSSESARSGFHVPALDIDMWLDGTHSDHPDNASEDE